MREMTIKEMAEAMNGEIFAGREDDPVQSVFSDSREVDPRGAFFAIKGDNADGHDFTESVAEQGCGTLVISDETKVPSGRDLNVIRVNDTLKALQDLSRYYLSTLHVKKKIAVTGSVGKTSTRDMMYCVASTKYRTERSRKNLNNKYGMPLTLLSIDGDPEVLVLEMGMEGQGEIDTLVHIADPDAAIITNVGMSHIEKLGSRENILKAKMEITDCFDRDSLLVVNQSCDILTKENVQGDYRLATVGTDGKSGYIVSNIRDLGEKGIVYTLEHERKQYEVTLPVPGAHNALNSALAIAAGREELDIPIEQAIEGLKNAKLTEKRLNIRGKNGIKVIDDTYNASLESMRSGIDTLMSVKGIRHVAVLGTIRELGDESDSVHYQVGRYAGCRHVDLLVVIGEKSGPMAEGALEYLRPEQVMYYDAKEDFIKVMGEIITAGDVVLVKGSRLMYMEEIVKKIFED